MEQKDRDHFDRMLLAEDPGNVSSGTGDLMRLMGGGFMPPPPGPPPSGEVSKPSQAS